MKYRRKDYKAVSEALGTILLLLISIILVSVVALWLSSIPREEDLPRVDLVASYDQVSDELTIEHQGGDVLLDADTQIVIKRNFVNTTRYTFTDA